MNFDTVAMVVVAGLMAGPLAGFFMKSGGYGLLSDVALALGGSVVGRLLFQVLGLGSDARLFAAVDFAFLGAVLVIVVQRTVWEAPAEGPC